MTGGLLFVTPDEFEARFAAFRIRPSTGQSQCAAGKTRRVSFTSKVNVSIHSKEVVWVVFHLDFRQAGEVPSVRLSDTVLALVEGLEVDVVPSRRESSKGISVGTSGDDAFWFAHESSSQARERSIGQSPLKSSETGKATMGEATVTETARIRHNATYELGGRCSRDSLQPSSAETSWVSRLTRPRRRATSCWSRFADRKTGMGRRDCSFVSLSWSRRSSARL